MDGKRVLEAAECCVSMRGDKCPYKFESDECNKLQVGEILAVRDHVKAEVIGKVREWVKVTKWTTDETGYCLLMTMLDELEQEAHHG